MFLIGPVFERTISKQESDPVYISEKLCVLWKTREMIDRTSIKEKVRDSNIELLRIIAMMGVIALHYVHGEIGGVENYAVYPHFLWFFIAAVRGFSIPLVNVFVLITGYFMVASQKHTFRKAIDLILIMVFYGVLIYCIRIIMQGSGFSFRELLKSMLPIFWGSSWFFRTYLVLYLLSPFINILAGALDLTGYRHLIIVQLILFSVWYSTGLSSPVADNGYGIINFITLYLLGGYIRKYLSKCEFLARITVGKGIIGYVLFALATTLASIFVNPFGYAFFTNICAAVCLFVSTVKRRAWHNDLVNELAKSSFDVFFVHGSWLFSLFRTDMFVNNIMIMSPKVGKSRLRQLSNACSLTTEYSL